MTRAIVTGAAGYLGYHLVKALTDQGVEVYALYRPGSEHIKRLAGMENVIPVACSLEEMDLLPQKCAERGYDVFYHLAWQGTTGEERADSIVQADNIGYTLAAVKSAAKMECRKFILAGTVCERQCKCIVNENKLSARAFYLLAKQAAYQLAKMECQRQGISFLECTFYHPIGKYNKTNQLVTGTILKLLKKESPKFDPGNQWFDVIDAEDLCKGLYLAGENKLKGDQCFIGSGTPHKLREYLEAVKRYLQSDVILQFHAFADDGMPMEYEWLDAAPFMDATGFQPQVSLEESVTRISQWLLEEEGECTY